MFERRPIAPPREPCSGVNVILYAGEPIEAALRRFKKVCERANVIRDYRRHECFVPRGERRRQKSKIARKRRGE